jgi:integrase
MVKGAGYSEGRHGKGRLFRRGRVWWVQYYAHHQQIRESSGSDKKAVAEKLLMRRLVEAESGTAPVREKPVTYQEMRDRLASVWQLNRSGMSRKDIDHSFARLDEFFAGLSSSLITEEKIDEFKLARLATGASTATINNALKALGQMFSLYAKRIKNPPEIKFLPDPPARKGFLTREEWLRLVAVLPEHLRPITTFAYSTGMRQGELENLTWQNVHLAEGVIRLDADQTKNGKARVIPFCQLPDLVDIVKGLEKRASGLVFTRRNGKPLGSFRKAWIRASIKALLGRMLWKCPTCHKTVEVEKQAWPPERQPGKAPSCQCGTKLLWSYKGLIFHDLRRTGVRNLRRAGVPESVAMKISGHQTRAVFERYNIVDDTDVHQAMEKLAAFHVTEDQKSEKTPLRPM